MFNQVLALFESYLQIIVHPFRIHDYWRHSIPLWSGHYQLPKLTLPESISISWFFWMIGAIAQMLLIQYSLELILSYQNENDIWYFLIQETNSLFPYYLIIFSLLLDLIFFPILTLVQTEVMNFVIRLYAKLISHPGPHDEMANQITTAALSSHFFSFIPIFGKPLVSLSYYFLLYAGLRRNFEASRALSMIIILTPMAVTFAFFLSLVLLVFYLVQVA